MGRKRRSQYVVEPPTPNTFMDPHENQFYHTMRRLEQLQAGWTEMCKSYEKDMRYYSKPSDAFHKMTLTFKHNQARGEIVNKTKEVLAAAGQILGYNPRFNVWMDNQEQIHIECRNGSAGRMMTRFDALEAMYELGRD